MTKRPSYDDILRNLTKEYIVTAREDIKRLRNHLCEFRRAKPNSRKKRQTIFNLYRIAHDIKGQGGSFGFQMMTRIGGALCGYLQPWYENASLDAPEADRIQRHIDALDHVISNGMRGPADEDGEALLIALKQDEPIAATR